MKKISILLILITLTVSGCISSKRYMQNGDYESAIKKSVKKLLKKPDKTKEILVLKQSYKIANQMNTERITYLKKTGEPDIWDDIFNIYNLLKYRQQLVKVLPQSILNSIGYEYINYDQEIIEAKKKAAEYFYAHAKILLNKGDRNNSRSAYYEFQKVKDYYTSYKDIDSLISQAIVQGTAHVLFKIQNKSYIQFPTDFESNLKKISLAGLNSLWLNYDTKMVEERSYAYVILVNVKIIDVSPESVKEIHYFETKEVEDGFAYKLDEKGNVMKDSLGNDIKIPKFKMIRCDVIEIQQKKTAIISGTIDFINNETNQLIKTDPITAQTVFTNNYVTAIGDINALTTPTKNKLGNKPLPFPSDPSMILQAGEILKDMAKKIIWDNKCLLD